MPEGSGGELTHPKQTSRKCHRPGLGLEPTRKEKSRATEKELEALNRRRNEDSRYNMGYSQEGGIQSSELESCC